MRRWNYVLLLLQVLLVVRSARAVSFSSCPQLLTSLLETSDVEGGEVIVPLDSNTPPWNSKLLVSVDIADNSPTVYANFGYSEAGKAKQMGYQISLEDNVNIRATHYAPNEPVRPAHLWVAHPHFELRTLLQVFQKIEELREVMHQAPLQPADFLTLFDRWTKFEKRAFEREWLAEEDNFFSSDVSIAVLSPNAKHLFLYDQTQYATLINIERPRQPSGLASLRFREGLMHPMIESVLFGKDEIHVTVAPKGVPEEGDRATYVIFYTSEGIFHSKISGEQAIEHRDRYGFLQGYLFDPPSFRISPRPAVFREGNWLLYSTGREIQLYSIEDMRVVGVHRFPEDVHPVRILAVVDLPSRRFGDTKAVAITDRGVIPLSWAASR